MVEEDHLVFESFDSLLLIGVSIYNLIEFKRSFIIFFLLNDLILLNLNKKLFGFGFPFIIWFLIFLNQFLIILVDIF